MAAPVLVLAAFGVAETVSAQDYQPLIPDRTPKIIGNPPMPDTPAPVSIPVACPSGALTPFPRALLSR